MSKQEMIYSTLGGVRLKFPVSKNYASVLSRVVSKEAFENKWKSGLSLTAIAHALDLNTTQASFLAEYYDMPEREKAQPSRPINVDALADRLWDDFAPRIQKMIDDAIEAI